MLCALRPEVLVWAGVAAQGAAAVVVHAPLLSLLQLFAHKLVGVVMVVVVLLLFLLWAVGRQRLLAAPLVFSLVQVGQGVA